jgi:exopolysaccharide biosynthesis polyprenyl glycosylphosphotransferase
MLKKHSSHLQSLLQTVDIGLAAAMFAGILLLPGMDAVEFDTANPAMNLLVLALFSTLAWPLALEQLGLYASQRLQNLRSVLARMAAAGALVILVQGTIAFLISAPVVPSFPLICGLAQLAMLALLRVGIFTGLGWLRQTGRNTRNVLIVGAGPRAGYVQRVIQQNPSWGLNIVGFIDRQQPADRICVDTEEIYALEDTVPILQEKVVDEVIVACPRSMLADIVGVVDACALAGVPITLLSDLFGDYLPAPRSARFGSLPALSFAPVHHSRVKLALKRGIDILGSSLLLILAVPILAAASLAIRLTSPGPVLFRQVRCGLNGRQFVMLKLRTMYVDADRRKQELLDLNEMDGPVFKIQNDPRVTPVGRVLRRLSIDELPQLWDVLRGDMSLVGPRPAVPVEVGEYQTFERRRLSMRPGLTCIWQVNGRNEIGFDDWVRLDLEYIDTWSLGNDLKILARTLPAVLSGEGAS